MRDSKGQVSLEYLLIFAVSLMVLLLFTLPLTEQSIEDTMDLADALDTKEELSKLTVAIKKVYGEGQGSKQTLKIHSDKNIKITIAQDHISCNLKLKDNSNKQIKEYFTSNLKKSSLAIPKGETIVVVEWPIYCENMLIYKK